MYYTYILQSKVDKSYYIGYTSDLGSRMYEHNIGKTRSIKSKLPMELIYYEAYLTKKQAIIRERQLKKNRSEKQRILERLIG